jgi:hypothetical protein
MRKRAEDLAATPFTSQTEHARRAPNFKRLAGALRNAAKLEGSGTTALFGLDEHETKAILSAAAVSKKAAAIGKKRTEARAAREKELQAAMGPNFAALSSLPRRARAPGRSGQSRHAAKGARRRGLGEIRRRQGVAPSQAPSHHRRPGQAGER